MNSEKIKKHKALHCIDYLQDNICVLSILICFHIMVIINKYVYRNTPI